MSIASAVVSLQDYLVDLDEEQKPTIVYNVLLENNTDFIVSRKTLKTERELVILVSQNLYYIKDKKSGAIESLTIMALKSFLRDIKNDIALNEVHWLSVLTKDSAEKIDRIVTDDVFVDMCRHNMLGSIDDPSWFSTYWRQNSRLFMQLHAMFPSLASSGKYTSSIPLIFELDKRYGYNEAMYFASQLVQSGIERFSTAERGGYGYGNDLISMEYKCFTQFLDEPVYNLQLRRFIDYVLFDLYAQGMTNVDYGFWREYKDYLDMQIQFYGKVKEKYPASFKTAHDIITLKFNTMKMAAECESFSARAKEIEMLAHQGPVYCIVIPNNPQEVADEGVNLSHCVKSYIGRVSNGQCHILFLRKSQTPEQSLVTMQLCGKSVCQAQGYSRRPVTKDERRFLERWAVDKGLQLDIS